MEMHIVNIKFKRTVTSTEISKAVEDLISQSRQEAGCIQYDVFENIEDFHSVIFFECWQTSLSLENHKNAVGILNFKLAVGHLISDKNVLR
jgi:quinol monooxygenase YgiN